MTRSTEQPTAYKIVSVGDEGSGKTSIAVRLMQNVYSTGREATIGSTFHTASSEDKRTKLKLWDTAGQECYRSLLPAYVRGAHLNLLHIDATQSEEEAVKSYRYWHSLTIREAPLASIVLVLTKTDHDDATLHQAENTVALLAKLGEAQQPTAVLATTTRKEGTFSALSMDTGEHLPEQTNKSLHKDFVDWAATHINALKKVEAPTPTATATATATAANAEIPQQNHYFPLTQRLWHREPSTLSTVSSTKALTSKGLSMAGALLSAAIGAAVGASIGALAGFLAFGPAGMAPGAAIGAAVGTFLGFDIGLCLPKLLPNLMLTIARVLLTPAAVIADVVDTVMPCCRPIQAGVEGIAGPASMPALKPMSD